MAVFELCKREAGEVGAVLEGSWCGKVIDQPFKINTQKLSIREHENKMLVTNGKRLVPSRVARAVTVSNRDHSS